MLKIQCEKCGQVFECFEELKYHIVEDDCRSIWRDPNGQLQHVETMISTTVGPIIVGSCGHCWLLAHIREDGTCPICALVISGMRMSDLMSKYVALVQQMRDDITRILDLR